MYHRPWFTLNLFVIIALLFAASLAACTSPTSTPTSPLPTTLPTVAPTLPPSNSTQGDKKRVALFVTRDEGDMFYSLVTGFGQEAAKDLDMTLDVYYAQGNHLRMVEQVKQVVTAADKPDAIVFINFKQRDKDIIEAAQSAQVPVIVMNSGVTPEYQMGAPREKYSYWIGSLLPDDKGAGYMLAQYLLQQATPDPDGHIYLIAIEGEIATGASIERVKGLQRAVSESPNAVLQQTVSANWDPAIAKEKAAELLRRYPKTTVIWTASDGMALGVAEALKEAHLEKKILTGGVDWSEEGIAAVRQGTIAASMGGHYMEAAWVLVMLYDYFHGVDFASESVELQDPMSLLTTANAAEVSTRLAPANWSKIDFTQFSKALHPELKTYPFSVDAVMAQLQGSPLPATATP